MKKRRGRRRRKSRNKREDPKIKLVGRQWAEVGDEGGVRTVPPPPPPPPSIERGYSFA